MCCVDKVMKVLFSISSFLETSDSDMFHPCNGMLRVGEFVYSRLGLGFTCSSFHYYSKLQYKTKSFHMLGKMYREVFVHIVTNSQLKRRV